MPHSHTATPASLRPGRPVEVAVPGEGGVEVTFLMPCLNEAETLAGCIEAARRCIDANGLSAEIIVADNGSTDRSPEIAELAGARVVRVGSRGYGAALQGGIAAARGRFIVMGDADLSYDFAEAMPLITLLRQGHDLAMGNRFKGAIEPGAMPLKNRYLGNPVLTRIGRVLFRCPVSDFHCGLRGFSKAAFERMGVRTPGMEFASDMVIRATLKQMRIAEAPITLRKDGRSRPPHLRPWRDGWRHLRFMLCLSPRWTLFAPGAALFAAGLVLVALTAAGPLRVGGAGGITLDTHTLIVGGLVLVMGSQWMATAVLMRVFALEPELGPPSARLARVARLFTLERGLLAAGTLILLGLAPIAWLVARWGWEGFGPLDLPRTIRPVVLGATAAALGAQLAHASLLWGMFRARLAG